MANSTSNLDLIATAQAFKEMLANMLFDAASPSMIWGRRASTTNGLTWGYFGGTFVNNAGTANSVANGTVTLTASTTNYLMANPSTGAVTSNTTGFTAGLVPLYSIVTGTTGVTSYLDYRSYQPSITGGQLQSVANEGTGVGIYDTGSTGGAVKLKSLVAGTGISVVDNGNGTITIGASGTSGTVTGGANEGSGVGVFDAANSTAATLKYKTLVASTGVTVTDNGTSGIALGASAAATAGPAVQQAGSTVVASATTVNFAAGFAVTQPSTGVAQVTVNSPYGTPDTPPQTSLFPNTVNFASATLTQQAWGAQLSETSQSSEYVAAAYMSAYPSTPFQCVVRLKVMPLLTNFNGAGIAIRDSGTGKVMCFGLHSQGTGAGYVGVKNYNSPTSYSGWQYNALTVIIPPNWIRVRDNGTTMYWDISPDGVLWTNLASFSRTAFLANPNQIGLFVNANGIATAACFFSFYAGV
ncbi:hypothetical protein BX604_2925 [Burkholderia sp. JKS000303]|nr:hypothetical protein BX604_2925 [Burkholderia sp. JKS000303]